MSELADWYSPAEAAEALGCSVNTVRAWIASGVLAHVRRWGLILVSRETLENAPAPSNVGRRVQTA